MNLKFPGAYYMPSMLVIAGIVLVATGSLLGLVLIAIGAYFLRDNI